MASASTRLYGATDFVEVTPNDTVNDSTAIKSDFAPGHGGHAVGLMVEAGGDIELDMISGRTVVLPVLPGVLYPVQFTHVRAASTTATGIFAAFQ